MLLNLHVKNLAIIDETEVDFAEGLNVLTGETGAGKSIVIGSIGIALGGKVDRDMIRGDAEFALVELTFLVREESLKKRLQALGVSLEEDTLLIARKITRQRTINRVNGESVTVSLLREIASLLLDIHGQNEQQSLLSKTKHLEIVDRYAKEGLGDRLERLAASYRRYQALSDEAKRNRMPKEERLREISRMEYELSEIESAALKEGEEEALAEKYKRLSNAAQIAQGLSEIYGSMEGQGLSVSEQLGSSLRTLSKLVEYDERLQAFYDALSQVDDLASDVARDISFYMDEFDVGAQELDKTERRLDLVRGMKAKYGATTEQVKAYETQLREKLEQYEQYEKYQSELQEKRREEEKALAKLSKEISEIRKQYAKELSARITEALVDLNFLQVRFSIEIKEKAEYSVNGTDEIEFMISANPGEPLRPLKEIASGGELSRMMLAIKAVLAEHDEIATMIFDEIDVGISGRTAQKVAEKLSVIAKTHQVICISHLAQIAAMADTHFLIEKENDQNHTKSQIRKLQDEEAVAELARILGGARITQAVTDSAKEMKQLALEWKCNRV